MSYNGWKNRETWLVNVWLGNDKFADEHSRDVANQKIELYERADTLKEFVYLICMGDDREIDGQTSGLAVDLLNDAIETVDFRELIQSYEEEND